MARRTRGSDPDQKCIGIAIHTDLDHALHISGGGSFVPQLLPAAGPEMGFACFERKLEGLPVHVCQHQDFFGLCILHDCRDESGGIESDIGK
jgi:hypothetical protein